MYYIYIIYPSFTIDQLIILYESSTDTLQSLLSASLLLI